MTQAWMILNNKYGFLVWDDKCKITFDKTKAMNYMYDLINDPENRKLMSLPDSEPYKIIEVEVEM